RADDRPRRALRGGRRGDDRAPRPALPRDPPRLPGRVSLPSGAPAHRERGRGRRQPAARPADPPLRAQPRHPADAVPQHGADVPGHDRGRRRPAHAGLRRGRSRARVKRLITVALAASVLAVSADGTTQGIDVPPGFRVASFASGLSHPTAMAYGPDGRIYVTQDGGTLVAIRPGTRKPAVLVRGLRTPLGLAWRGDELFVSEQGRLERFTVHAGRLVGRRVIVKGLPFGEHQQDNVVLHDGRLYWGSGST